MKALIISADNFEDSELIDQNLEPGRKLFHI